MKIYKFRELDNELDYFRLKEIIETGKFWCSKFSDLNDPMEGIFIPENINDVDKFYEGKGQFKICSFSGEKGFLNPLMWGYYAKGFKGVVIEIETNDYMVSPINYNNYLPTVNNPDMATIKQILLHKNEIWKHEDEYRFLDQLENQNNSIEIGKITSIYFGGPYSNFINIKQIISNTNHFNKYFEYKSRIIKISQKKRIKCFSIKIKERKITIGEEI